MRKSSRGNPYHDERGRFTSADSASRGSGAIDYSLREQAISDGDYDKKSARDLQMLAFRLKKQKNGAKINEWEVRPGENDLWYEAYKNGEPAFGVIDGEVNVYNMQYRAYAQNFAASCEYSMANQCPKCNAKIDDNGICPRCRYNINERKEKNDELQGRTDEAEGNVQRGGDSYPDDRSTGERAGNHREGHGGTSGNSRNVLRQEINANKFKDALDIGRETTPYGCYVDSHEIDELESMKMFLSEDGLAGIAVEDDGNICCAFKNSNCKTKGMVNHLLQTAKENGGTKMDCFGQKLTNMYEANGFVPVARIPFNPEYIEKNEFNRKLLENKPEVYVLMKRPKGEENHLSSKEELGNLLLFDGEDGYDEALAYRDSLLAMQLNDEND